MPEPTKKDLNKSENSIKNTILNHNLEDQSLTIWFKRGSRTLFKDIKEVIYNKLNDFKTLDKAYFKIFYKVNGDKRNTIFSLNNERGMILLSNLLKGDNFELLANNEDNDIIECSDTNKDNINAISYDMLTGIKFFNVDAEQKGINIYTDNGGSFYPYKINKTFENCKPILKTLLKYQITNDLKNNVDMFSYNCLTWALKMSDKFDKTTIENMRTESYKRYISHNDLQKLGEDYHIGFKVKKYRKDNDVYKWHDITNGKKKYIGDQNPKIEINLSLVEKHYFINEEVFGINKYALEH